MPPPIAPGGGAGRHPTALINDKDKTMIPAPRIIAGVAAAAITAAIALTPTTSSDASKTGSQHRPDVGARHMAHRVIR